MSAHLSSRVLIVSNTFGAASRTSLIRARANRRLSGSTWPSRMKPRVFLAHRHGFALLLVVHEVAQVATSTGQPLTKILRGDFQQIGADSIAYAEDRAEDVSQTLLAIEAKQHT